MHYFSPLNSFMRKGKDPDPHLWLMDPDPGGPKTSGSPTLAYTPTETANDSLGRFRLCSLYRSLLSLTKFLIITFFIIFQNQIL